MSLNCAMSESTRAVTISGQEAELVCDFRAESEVIERYDNIVKSQEDKRLYRGLVLANRMKVLLISDTRTEKAAAALDVGVGYMSDPDELPGLANLCQHMLTIGTGLTKNEHGGSSNAWTYSDHTTYHFDVWPARLDTALYKLSNLLAWPSFPESAMSQQQDAINIEYETNLSSDSWRMQQMIKNTSLHTHPYRKFGTGNIETLKTIPRSNNVNVRLEIVKFYRKWYSSNIMSLVVLGKQSLDELQTMVVSFFSHVEDKSVTSPMWPEHPFPQELGGKKVYCVPVADIRVLYILFPLPDMRQIYKSAPGQYLSYLISHQGPGSLLATLKSKEWCTTFEDSIEGARGFSFFRIQMELTEEGLSHTDDILHLLFQYLAMLRTEGPQRWAWQEVRDLKALEFRFKLIEDPGSMVESHVRLLQDFPIEDVLSAQYLITDWNPDLITEMLSLLTPESVRIMVSAKAFVDKCTMTEPWYGTKYCLEEINDTLLKEWSNVKVSEDLHLPPPNEFIPTNLSLVKFEEDVSEIISPILVKDTSLIRLWYKQDTEFLLPKAWITFDILSPTFGRLCSHHGHGPLPYADPLSCNLTLTWVCLLRDSLQQLAYASQTAGVMWKIDYIEQGITVTIEGFNDKQDVLLDKIMEHIVTFRAEPKQFLIIKQKYLGTLTVMETDQPHDTARYEIALCLADLAWSRNQLLETAKDITVELLNEFVSSVIRNVHIEGFVFGNFTKEKAVQIADSVEKKFQNEVSPHVI